jgi:hypothetical protein
LLVLRYKESERWDLQGCFDERFLGYLACEDLRARLCYGWHFHSWELFVRVFSPTDRLAFLILNLLSLSFLLHGMVGAGEKFEKRFCTVDGMSP